MVDDDVVHESIQLRFRKWIRAFELDGVLGRKDVERFVEPIGPSLNGDAMLLHRLEQRRLRLGRRTIDLVGQHDIAEDRPRRKHHLAAAGCRILLNQVRARDIRRHQVGRELDSRELEVDYARQGRDEQRLRETRDADDQAITAHEERQQHLVDDVVLSDDQLFQLGDNLFAPGIHLVGECDVVR